jgi:hypothetical protein
MLGLSHWVSANHHHARVRLTRACAGVSTHGLCLPLVPMDLAGRLLDVFDGAMPADVRGAKVGQESAGGTEHRKEKTTPSAKSCRSWFEHGNRIDLAGAPDRQDAVQNKICESPQCGPGEQFVLMALSPGALNKFLALLSPRTVLSVSARPPLFGGTAVEVSAGRWEPAVALLSAWGP